MVYNTILSYTYNITVVVYPCIGILISYRVYTVQCTQHMYYAFFYFRVDTYNDIKIHTYFGSVRITYI